MKSIKTTTLNLLIIILTAVAAVVTLGGVALGDWASADAVTVILAFLGTLLGVRAVHTHRRP